jgi:hypothetical protein
MTAALFLGFLGMLSAPANGIGCSGWAVRVVHLCRPVGILRRCQKRGDAPPGIMGSVFDTGQSTSTVRLLPKIIPGLERGFAGSTGC